jgi:hypothetical protein
MMIGWDGLGIVIPKSVERIGISNLEIIVLHTVN